MEKTTNYQLPKWEKSDFIKMDDFNDAFGKLDAALKANADAAAGAASAERVTALAQDVGAGGKNCRIAWGSYRGNGKYGAANPTSLSFDFKPELILIGCQQEDAGIRSWMLRPVTKALACCGANIQLTWTEAGVSWVTQASANQHTHQNNTEGYVYHYVALGYTE